MTDREAIRRLASMVAVLSGMVGCWKVEERAAALENELLAEPDFFRAVADKMDKEG